VHLLDLLAAHPILQEIGHALSTRNPKPETQILTGVPSPAWGALAADLQCRAASTLLLVVPNTELAERCAHDLNALFDGEPEAPTVLLFPVPDRSRNEEAGGDSRAAQQRLGVLDALHRAKSVIVVAPVNALAQSTLPPDELRRGYDSVAVGQTLDREEFLSHLVEIGYERVDEVEAGGQFAARGGLIDFFPPASEQPIRLELFGDEIDSLRAFDIETQRSTDKLSEFRLTPPREEYLTPARGREIAAHIRALLEGQLEELHAGNLHDEAGLLKERIEKDIARLEEGAYFPELARYRALLYPAQPTLFEHLPESAVVLWADPERAQSQNQRLLDDDEANRVDAVAEGVLLPLPAALCSYETLRERAAKFCQIEFRINAENVDRRSSIVHDSEVHLPPSFGGKLDAAVKWIKDRQSENAIIVVSTSHARRVREILADGHVLHVHLLDAMNEAQPQLVLLMPQRLTAGFSLPSPPRPPSPAERERGEANPPFFPSSPEEEVERSISPLSRSAGEGGRGGEGRTPRASSQMVTRARALRKSQTNAEELLWELLRDRRLDGNKFRRQHPIGHFIADFYCREAHLIIEVDGAVHAEATQQARDAAREEILQQHGFRILRFSNEQVLDSAEKVIEEIRNFLISHSPSPAERPGALRVVSTPASGITILTDAELFGWQANLRLPVKARKREAKTKFVEKSKALSQLSDLKHGDYVVHIQHGIARYSGVVRQEVGGATGDYLLLEYAGNDRLYVPISQLDRVQKYLGAGAAVPALHTLKSQEWERTKKRVREEIAKVAKQLAELYAAREQADKEPISPDSPWQREMESAFPYEETPSQLQAIKDTKGDLQSDKPMDRLICGDVGFGKTEVAVRAAFKVVQDGKQVAVLVPTTVLAQQHYQTFSERLAPYPARVDVISRFRTPAEQRQIIEDVKLGAVDILIGTHRLLQKDVEFHNLGLVIVDEEQRFGVMQKERLKELRKQVDILTLSATPIPRTLHFALGGLREISLINDPPQGRLPVRTFVMPFRDEVVRQAIERELEREGQVYFVHNRIGSIFHIREKLQQLVPDARIGVGHGQMSDEELEQVMLDFMHHRTDVLLATTIIENGLDLPNVNTIIVDRAERLGLSQMYQLRGRVGRSSRQAYSYFLMGARGKVGEEAEERFAAIQEYTDLGAGFKIAMRDLEIRGAGDLLGVKQSGSIAAVGFEMYSEMLEDAVRRLKRQPREYRDELPEADLPVPAFLPDEYVASEPDRLSLYRKMANVRNLEEVEHLQAELRDRFGPLPMPAFNLLRILRIRVHLLHAHLRGITKSEQEILIRLKPSDRFADEDIAAVYAKLREENDARTLQNLMLRPMEGLAIDTRVLTPVQLLRMTEQACEALAITRGARLLK
jgi:transcription-repair coupling factor